MHSMLLEALGGLPIKKHIEKIVKAKQNSNDCLLLKIDLTYFTKAPHLPLLGTMKCFAEIFRVYLVNLFSIPLFPVHLYWKRHVTHLKVVACKTTCFLENRN